MRLQSRRRSRPTTVLLLAAGTVAGLALGALLADRMGGLDGLLGKMSREDRLAARRRRRQEAESEPDIALSDAEELIEAEPARGGQRGDAERAVAERAVAERAMAERAPAAARRSSPDEATLEARVLEAFHNDPVLSERAIDIGAIGTGVIELTGWVHSRSEIGHAVTLARGVPDVTTVVDRLAVREVAGRRVTKDAPIIPDSSNQDSLQPPRAD